HLARGPAALGLDPAAGLLLERLDPLRLEVALPGDHRQLAFALADLGRRAARAAHPDGGYRQRRRGDCKQDVLLSDPHSSSLSCPIGYMCSGSQASCTERPRSSSTSADVRSRFCLTTTSSPPSATATTYRVTIPA